MSFNTWELLNPSIVVPHLHGRCFLRLWPIFFLPDFSFTFCSFRNSFFQQAESEGPSVGSSLSGVNWNIVMDSMHGVLNLHLVTHNCDWIPYGIVPADGYPDNADHENALNLWQLSIGLEQKVYWNSVENWTSPQHFSQWLDDFSSFRSVPTLRLWPAFLELWFLSLDCCSKHTISSWITQLQHGFWKSVILQLRLDFC